MAAESIPYHLRSHKSVDRRLFIDLLARYERWRAVDDHVYFSMGAYALEDHKLAHRILGITKLIAFDRNEKIVARQKFNRPIETCRCITKSSGEMVADPDGIALECGFSSHSGFIFWLDYTEPKKIGEQVREFQSLLDKLSPGDVIRVTVNANPMDSLDEDKASDEKKVERKEERMKRQLARLKSLISDFLPPESSFEDMTLDGLPLRLSQAFSSAASKSIPPNSRVKFCPLSIVRYADTTQMLSITGVLVEKKEEDRMKAALSLKDWALYSSDWTEIHQLVVPALTLRERLFLEREVCSKSEQELLSELEFFKGSNIDLSQFISSYKKYYRFYPTLLSADI
jgi:hypothetical protein